MIYGFKISWRTPQGKVTDTFETEKCHLGREIMKCVTVVSVVMVNHMIVAVMFPWLTM